MRCPTPFLVNSLITFHVPRLWYTELQYFRLTMKVLCGFFRFGLVVSIVFALTGGSSANAETLTSLDCPSLRFSLYPARLELFYFYLVEFANTTSPDLPGIERAIAIGLLDSFDGCNAYGEPLHAVRLNDDGHRYSSGSSGESGYVPMHS